MQILVVFACTDLFSYDGFGLQRQCLEGDYTKRDLENLKKEYVSLFSKKAISKLSLTHVDISPTGEVSILDNIQGENPLKEYKEINPAAVKARAAREAKRVNPYVINTAPPIGPTPVWATGGSFESIVGTN